MTAQLDRDIFGNLLARTEAGGAQRYYHPDGLGSTTALTDETGAVSATMLYDAWGNVRVNSGDAHGKYRFTGAELDETTGLYHMGARFYDPAVGRWLSEDPVQDKLFEPATLNFYAYVNNIPAILVDLDGKAPCGIDILFDSGGGDCGSSGGGSGGGKPPPPREPQRPRPAANAAARAEAIANTAVDLIRNNQAKLSHIFGPAKHGFGALGITMERGLAAVARAIAEGVQRAGPSGLSIGQVYAWSALIEAGVRVSVRGIWDGTVFRIGTAFLEILVNGQWVRYTP